MIRDLKNSGEVTAASDIVIVGGGSVGLFISSILANKGFDVTTIESGGLEQKEETHSLNKVIYKNYNYNSSNIGRFRCLGGTSTRWGGGLLPFPTRDLIDGNWPLPPEELSKYLHEVENFFKLNHDSYNCRENLGKNNSNFILRYAKLPSFKNRNVFNLLKKEILKENGPSVWINATVNEFKVKDKALEEIIANSTDGSRIKVRANKFIFASGAIESTRLMLLLDKQNNNCISNISPSLGKFFSDHISIPVSNIEIKNKNKMNEIFGYHFDTKQTMKNIRFELNENSKLRKIIPPFFSRLVFSDMSGSYENLRDFFRIIQKKNIPSIKNFIDIIKSFPWIFKAGLMRFFKKRLLFPNYTKLEAHIIMEQISSISNQITLSKEEKDVFEQPLAIIDWTINKEDYENIINASGYLKDFWNSSSLKLIGNFNLKNIEEINEYIKKGDGIHHPTGSTRMAISSTEGVVNKDLKLFSLKNTRILSTSVFPTGGGANPTMTLFMLALRCVDQICLENNNKN
jgi:hypothetical protein